jgi:hypothetical protein
MARRKSDQEPVPMAPAHRKVRRHWRRAKCSCGLAWPCPDRLLLNITRQRPATDPHSRAWALQQTALYPPMGRARRLTPGQAYRTNDGRS